MFGVRHSDMPMQPISFAPRTSMHNSRAHTETGCEVSYALPLHVMEPAAVAPSILLCASAFDFAQNGREQPARRSLDGPPSKSQPLAPSESPDNKVIPLVPRRKPEPERVPDPPDDEGDDDDPGPAAA
jgi:hypothetical protein